MKRQILDCQVKANVEDESRVLRFVGTTSSRDRMGDEINAKGWDTRNYMKNPVFLWAHDYSTPPIGRTVSIEKHDDSLVFDVEFVPAEVDPKAEQIYQLYKRGFLKATSVGFSSKKSEWIDCENEDEIRQAAKEPDAPVGKKFHKVELLELSAVPVPANPDALMVARRKGMDMPSELRLVADLSIVKDMSDKIDMMMNHIVRTNTKSDNDPNDIHDTPDADVASTCQEDVQPEDVIAETTEEVEATATADDSVVQPSNENADTCEGDVEAGPEEGEDSDPSAGEEETISIV